MAATGESLSKLAETAPRAPQVLLNVAGVDRDGLDDATAVWDEVRRVEEGLGDTGRVLVRPSGTEPIVRVMVEATTEQAAEDAANRIAKAVRDALGS